VNTGTPAGHREGSVSMPGTRPDSPAVTINTRNRHDTGDSHRRATMRTGISDPNVKMVPTET
jgi:hypothetical protein